MLMNIMIVVVCVERQKRDGQTDRQRQRQTYRDTEVQRYKGKRLNIEETLIN